MKLNRHIGPLGLTFIAVSGVIGSGWIFGPLVAAQIAGPAALISWVIGSLGMFVQAVQPMIIAVALPWLNAGSRAIPPATGIRLLISA